MRRDAAWSIVALLWLPSYLCPLAARAQQGLGPLPPFDAHLVEYAREGAMRRLRAQGCQRLFHELRDQDGKPLEQRLASFGVSADQYLAMIPLLDGTRRPLCRAGHTQLLAVRGAARVLVCEPFLKTVFREREAAELYLIHEMLHTLGLGENPPSSQQIAKQVKNSCAP